MHKTLLNFDQLIHPIDSATFFSQYWEKQPLFIAREQSNYYAGLLSMADIDTLLQFSKPQYPEVKLGKNKGFSLQILEGMNTTSIHDYGVPALHRLYRAYAEGDTIIINRLIKYWEPIARFCSNLEEFFSHPVGANVYLSRPRSQAFAPHFDGHDIFVLQLEGTKLWRIYNTSPHLSLDRSYQPLLAAESLVPEQEIYLHPGDLLYVPRGCVHAVSTADSFSLHLSIGIQVTTWIDLLTTALATVSQHHLPFREALPIGFLNQPERLELMQAKLFELCDSFSKIAKFSDAMESLN